MAKRRDLGFTLTELMIGVAIIAIVLAVVVATLGGARTRAHDASARTSLRAAAEVAALSYNDATGYPATVGDYSAAEAGLTFQASVSAGPKQVSIAPSAVNLLMASRSASGTCHIGLFNAKLLRIKPYTGGTCGAANLTTADFAPAGPIATTIGTGSATSSGDGGPAASAALNGPARTAHDSKGNLYVVELSGHRVRKVTPAGVISTFAGTGTATSTGDGGPATSATINSPYGVAVDRNDNVYIAEAFGYRVRKVDANGIVSTVVGTGTAGSSGDGGPATSATVERISDIAFDTDGNMYLCDLMWNKIRKVTPAGIISTFAGTGAPSSTGDGGPATAATMETPLAISFDGAGNLYVAEYWGSRVRKITPAGIISTVVGDGTLSSTGDGGPATAATINQPAGIAHDLAGNMYINESAGNRIRVVAANGTITTFAGTGAASFSGDGGAPTSATLNAPNHVHIDGSGNFYTSDYGNHRVRKIAV